MLLDIGERYGDLAVAKSEFRQLLLVVEQRVEPRYFLGVRVLDRFQLVRKLARGKDLFRAVRRAYRVEHLRVFGEYRFFGTERNYEPLSELAQKVQRSAEERHVAAYRLAARKPRYRLIDYGLKNRRRDIRFFRAVVDERLDVGLGKNTAPRRDGVDHGRVLGELVESRRVGIEQYRHLVDERARTARASPVHALVDAVVQICYLGVLAAELYSHVGLGDNSFYRFHARDDFLYERYAEPFGYRNPARARDGNGKLVVLGEQAFEHGVKRRAHVGIVPLIARVYKLAVRVEDGGLNGR